MPPVVACPRCRKLVGLEPSDSGRKVLCPACGLSFVAPRIAAPSTRPHSNGPTSNQATSAVRAADPPAPPPPADRRPRIALYAAGGIVGVALVATLVVWAVAGRERTDDLAQTQPAPHAVATRPVTAARVVAAPPATRLVVVAPAPPAAGKSPAKKKPLFETEVAPAPEPVVATTVPAGPENRVAAAVAQTAPAGSETRPAVAAATPGDTLDLPADDEPATQPAGSAPTLSDTQPVAANRPPLRPIPLPRGPVTDQEVELAIRRGVKFLLSRFSAKSFVLASVENPPIAMEMNGIDRGHQCGEDALAVYALLQCGLAINDPRLAPNSPIMNNLIEAMKRLPCETGHVTYAKGIRATALALFNRPPDRQALVNDVNYLIRTQVKGAYGYAGTLLGPSGPMPGGWWDNSNSQYGLLGVWSAAEAGYEIPNFYWHNVEDHWTGCQLPNGMWSYQAPVYDDGSAKNPNKPWEGEGSGTMTAAGIVSLYIAYDYTMPVKFSGDVGRDPFTPPLRKALDFWERGDNYVTKGQSPDATTGYTVYGIERVGLASGFKYFGAHDWFREMAQAAIQHQLRNGSWGTTVDTSYILLFLSRGRHPILMNKLRFDKVPEVGNRYWDNRPRDLAGLTRWATRQLERPLNWQIVNLESDWPDWMDSPILYIASHRALRFREADYAKFRNFAVNGGTIFLHADGDDRAFADWAKEFGKKLFPQYEFQDVPPDHPIYGVNYRLNGRPPLRALSNGARLLVILVPKDVARYWHSRDDKLHPDAFRFGLNLFLYAGGKRGWRNRLDVPYLPEPTAVPVQTVAVGRLQYAGNWDPEPGAWQREKNVFQYATGYGIDVQPLKWQDLAPGVVPIVHLTGTAKYDPPLADLDALKKYVQAGGVVLIDSCGGSETFTQTMRRALAMAFPDAKLQPLVPGHPLLNQGAPGMQDLTKRVLRPFVTDKLGADYGGFDILSSGKGHLIFSALDVTSGLLGTNTWGIWGWDPQYAQAFIQNLIFWTLDGQKDEAVDR